MAMNDDEILHQITVMTSEEHALLQQGEQNHGLVEDQRAHLNALKVEIDQLWDLLRQRRARRHAGLNPEGAQERDPGTVENYKQ